MITIDGCWGTRGHAALECTVFVVDYRSQHIIEMENVGRFAVGEVDERQEPHAEWRKFRGSAKAMEAEGVRAVLLRYAVVIFSIVYFPVYPDCATGLISLL